MKLYEALKAEGHSPQKAAEIVLDVKRNVPHAVKWAEIVARGRKMEI